MLRCLLSDQFQEVTDGFPTEEKNLAVYLRGGCNKIFYTTARANTEDDLSYQIKDPCYQIQFHAEVLEGRFKGLNILVTRKFSPMKTNPLNGVDLDVGMVVHVSGTLTAHPVPHSKIGVPASFHLDAKVVKRDVSHSKDRADYDKKRSAIDASYRPCPINFDGFEC